MKAIPALAAAEAEWVGGSFLLSSPSPSRLSFDTPLHTPLAGGGVGWDPSRKWRDAPPSLNEICQNQRGSLRQPLGESLGLRSANTEDTTTQFHT